MADLRKRDALAALVAALAAVLPASGAAVAQTVCGARADIVAELETTYGETRRSFGLQQGRGIVEVYASSETGSWTILMTNTNGRSCLVASGVAFEALPPAVADTPA